MDSTLVDQCRNDHKESRRGHIDLQKSPSSSYRLFKVKQCSGHTSSCGDSGNRCRASSSKDIMNTVVQLRREDYRVVMGDLYRLINRYRKC